MELREALSKANQILDEERVHPTVGYERVSKSSNEAAQALAAFAGDISLRNQRDRRPRPIIEDPAEYRFQSTNYNLLCALLSRLNKNDRPGFVSGVAVRLFSAPGCIRKQS